MSAIINNDFFFFDNIAYKLIRKKKKMWKMLFLNRKRKRGVIIISANVSGERVSGRPNGDREVGDCLLRNPVSGHVARRRSSGTNGFFNLSDAKFVL